MTTRVILRSGSLQGNFPLPLKIPAIEKFFGLESISYFQEGELVEFDANGLLAGHTYDIIGEPISKPVNPGNADFLFRHIYLSMYHAILCKQ